MPQNLWHAESSPGIFLYAKHCTLILFSCSRVGSWHLNTLFLCLQGVQYFDTEVISFRHTFDMNVYFIYHTIYQCFIGREFWVMYMPTVVLCFVILSVCCLENSDKNHSKDKQSWIDNPDISMSIWNAPSSIVQYNLS